MYKRFSGFQSPTDTSDSARSTATTRTWRHSSTRWNNTGSHSSSTRPGPSSNDKAGCNSRIASNLAIPLPSSDRTESSGTSITGSPTGGPDPAGDLDCCHQGEQRHRRRQRRRKVLSPDDAGPERLPQADSTSDRIRAGLDRQRLRTRSWGAHRSWTRSESWRPSGSTLRTH